MADIDRPAKSFMALPGMRPSHTTDPDHPNEPRLRGFEWLPNRARSLFISMLGEFVGTFLFLFFAFAGTQVANTSPADPAHFPNTSQLLYIALAFGFSLAVNVWVFFRISGGLFNPAVTFALALVGAVGWLKSLLLVIAQILGAISAAGIVSALFPGNLAVRTRLNPTTSHTRGLFIEAFLTAELIFTIFMLAAEKHRATFLAPIGIGLALFIAELAGVFFTGGSLNPARSFGPDVVLGTFDGYHWLYWVGPLIGALIAVLFYRFIKALEYESANPGADHDGLEFHPGEPPASERRATDRATDGTDETDVLPTARSKPAGRSRRDRPTNSSHDQAHNSTSATKPSHVTGGDATYSRGSADNTRTARKHNSESGSSYRSGPEAELGSAGLSGSTKSTGCRPLPSAEQI